MTSDWNGLAEACSSAADNIEKNMEPVRFHPPMVLLRRAAAALAQAGEIEKALRDLLEVVEMSDMECRDLVPFEYDAILVDAVKRARRALAATPEAGKKETTDAG